jgi:hypothetical protein
MVIGDDDVLRAVPIEVNEAGAKTHISKPCGRDAGATAGEDKLRVAQIAIERVGLVLIVRDED